MRQPRAPRAAGRGVAMATAAACMAWAHLGCTPRQPQPPPPPARPLVVVSVLPQAYFIERLAGDRVSVEVMIPPGASPVTYEPGMKQMTALSRAALFVKVGHSSFAFEKAWLDRLLESTPGMRVVNASQGIPERPGDPHTWVAPTQARVMARNLANALTDLLPAHADAIRQSLEGLLADFDAAQKELDRALKGKVGRRVFLLHDAWGYLLGPYGIEQVAVEEGGREPDPAALAKLVKAAKTEGATAVFIQPQMDPTPARVLAKEIGARVETIDPLARDWVANMRHVAAKLGGALLP